MASKKTVQTLLLLQLGLFTALPTFSQYNTRPTRSRFYNSKFSTFSLNVGDTLVYQFQKDTHQLTVLLKVERPSKNRTANISVAGIEGDDSTIFQLKALDNKLVVGGPVEADSLNKSDTLAIWLDRKSFSDLVTIRETRFTVNNVTENFKRVRYQTMKIRYKGKEKIVTVMILATTGSNPPRYLSVLTEEGNPLIMRTETGSMLTLKEVR